MQATGNWMGHILTLRLISLGLFLIQLVFDSECKHDRKGVMLGLFLETLIIGYKC